MIRIKGSVALIELDHQKRKLDESPWAAGNHDGIPCSGVRSHAPSEATVAADSNFGVALAQNSCRVQLKEKSSLASEPNND